MSGAGDSNPLLSFDGWELEEKLSHVRRILRLPSPLAGPTVADCSTAPSLRDGQTAFGWLCAKAAVGAGSCCAVLLVWSAFASRRDLLAPAAATAVAGLAAWLAEWLAEWRHDRIRSSRGAAFQAVCGSPSAPGADGLDARSTR